MHSTKLIVLGGFLTCISAVFQILPIFLSEAFVILTMFSAFPIYIISRTNPKIGLTAAIASFIVISFFSTHEALFFLFTNGPVGVSLGCCSYFTRYKKVVVFITSAILSVNLSIMNFIIGIPVFGTPLPGVLIIQILIVVLFSMVYSSIYLYFCNYFYRKITKYTTKY